MCTLKLKYTVFYLSIINLKLLLQSHSLILWGWWWSSRVLEKGDGK